MYDNLGSYLALSLTTHTPGPLRLPFQPLLLAQLHPHEWILNLRNVPVPGDVDQHGQATSAKKLRIFSLSVVLTHLYRLEGTIISPDPVFRFRSHLPST